MWHNPPRRHGVAEFLLLVLVLVAAGLQRSGRAQQTTGQQPQAIFRSSTRLVVQTVSVKDKDGKPVEGLTAKDFIVTEDGQPQDIAFVEFQRLQGASAPADTTLAATPAAAAPAAAAPAPARPANDVPSVVQNGGIAAPAAGDARFRDR